MLNISSAARSLAVTMLGAAMTMAAAPAALGVDLVFNNYAPPPSPVTKVLFRYFADELQKRSNGDIKVTIPTTSLAPVDGTWELVTSGVADVVNMPRYVMPQRFKLIQLAELPFNTLSSQSASIALNRTYQKYFAKFDEYKGVKVLAFTTFAGRQIMNKVRPIETVKDYQGLKVWTTPGPLAKAVEATGAVPIVAPFPQLFEFASKGTIDGMIFTPETARSSQTERYVKYYTSVPGGLGNLAFAMVMNLDRWKSLSPSQQKIIQEVADTLPAEFGRAQDESEASAQAAMQIEIKQASPELIAELKTRLASMEGAWLATAKQVGIENPAEVLAYYRSQMEQVASTK